MGENFATGQENTAERCPQLRCFAVARPKVPTSGTPDVGASVEDFDAAGAERLPKPASKILDENEKMKPFEREVL